MPHIKTNIAQLEQAAPVILNSAQRKPLVLVGMVGIAKTQWIKSTYHDMYAEHLGLSSDQVGFIQERVANRDSAEIAGVALPCKTDDGEMITTFTKPPLITKIERTGLEHGIILFDEMLQAPADVQKVLADLLDPDERTLAGWPIPDGWIVAATGNRVADKSGASRLLSHLLNRCRVFELEFSINQWGDWARDNGVNPLAVDCAFTYYNEGFFAESVPTEDGPFCTPRSLVHAASDLTAFMDTDAFDGAYIPPHIEALVASSIGQRAAGMVTRHIAMADEVPQAEDIYNGPNDARVPDATGYQLLAANRAINGAHSAALGEATLQYIVRLRPDLQVSLGTKLLRASAKNGWVLTSDVATAFIQKFHELIPLADAADWR